MFDIKDGRQRVVIEGVSPEVDGGRYPAKRAAGERVDVEADIFADGHDVLSAHLLYRHQAHKRWERVAMELLVNDRWRGGFVASELGAYQFTIEAWTDEFGSWRQDLKKKVDAGMDVSVELLAGARLVMDAAERATGDNAERLRLWGKTLEGRRAASAKVRLALSDELAELVAAFPDTSLATRYGRELTVVVDSPRARFSAWYELFPRSTASKPGKHGTFRDCERWLPYIASMGFDVMYLTPVHPIGKTHRKGKNNATKAKPNDPGSPWAIGSKEGGHKSVHPDLGTLADFHRLVKKASEHGVEVALDIALQCSPDHPYVKEHPEWFRWRPDGTIQYAENPPKKYEDIYPLNFETDAWRELWEEMRSIFLFWVEQGVRIFRVDNPHTKPFPFWEWLIGSIRQEHPDVIFLSEAFTRPKVMYDLAKVGFNQSYTYFAWRNTQWELTQYFTELTQTPVREVFRPNLWPSTQDILTEYLQSGGRPAFMIRFILGATLGANYGIYGPAFELCENVPREPGSEEYLNSEKYELRHWDVDRPDSLRDLIARVNRIRRENQALRHDWTLRFHHVDNEQLICYSKQSDDGETAIITVVSLDPNHTQSGWVALDLDALGIDSQQPYQVHDLLSDARYLWHGAHNFVQLEPLSPAHVFRVRRHVRTERDFEYYM